ncbi:FadR/GntR family transcriptional regulator [Thalassobacillus hwangdonensis]|uniref:FadR/GntR family transcriptional regulator n=1 Tax=Thalassobacillus hwangdonensis TaxID=546108 RepID=A0ABW3L0X2_9BACI
MTVPQKSKVYEEVLQQIKHYIEKHKLRPGDKLPSERDLSEQLNVGRSSIREAFRALELLGLIETRRGEGTFMRSYRPYHMVELLSTFILHEARTKCELYAAKIMLEVEVVQVAAKHITTDQLAVLQDMIEAFDESIHYDLFQYLFNIIDNDLLHKMWQLIDGFANTIHQFTFDQAFYEKLLEALKNDECENVRELYRLKG